MKWIIVGAVAGALGCGGASGVETTSPPPVKDTTAEVSETSDCPPLPTGGQEAFDEAEAFKVTGGEYSPERQGAQGRRVALYVKAAKAGHVGGQRRAGNSMFGRMFQADAPKEEERADYVEALTYLFIASTRDPEKSDMPGMADIAKAGQLPEKLETPLADVPRAWVEEALNASKAWMVCYGK